MRRGRRKSGVSVSGWPRAYRAAGWVLFPEAHSVDDAGREWGFSTCALSVRSCGISEHSESREIIKKNSSGGISC